MKNYIFVLILAVVSFCSYSVSHAAITVVPDETSWQNLVGSWRMADFEGFTGSIGDRYPNLSFYDFNGGSPFSIEEFPYDGTNSLFTVFPLHGGGGGFAADFEAPVNGIAFWAFDLQFEGTIISFYNSTSSLLGLFDLLADGNGNGPHVYGFNGFVSDSIDISRIELEINGADAVWFDNFQYAPVPIPASFILMLSGLAGLVSLKKRRRIKG